VKLDSECKQVFSLAAPHCLLIQLQLVSKSSKTAIIKSSCGTVKCVTGYFAVKRKN
jgi:hypothetical protein